MSCLGSVWARPVKLKLELMEELEVEPGLVLELKPIPEPFLR